MITREQVKTGIDLVEEQYLEVLHNLIRQFQLLPVPPQTGHQLSLMDKLLSVKLSGPPDLAENIDAYLNGEKHIEE